MSTDNETRTKTHTIIRAIAVDVFAVCGVASIGLGLWQIYQPAAYIGVGAILFVGAVLASREG